MLTELNIGHFRVFHQLQMKRLARINLIAGNHSVGKTSLLEALFLLSGAGNIRMALNNHVTRGLKPHTHPGAGSAEIAWLPLFFGLDSSRLIEIRGKHTQFGQPTLKIRLQRPQIAHLSPAGANGDQSMVTNQADDHVLVFAYHDQRHQGKGIEGQILFQGMQYEIRQDPTEILFPTAIWLPNMDHARDDAMRLSELRRNKGGQVLVDALRIIEPELQSIEINTVSGHPMIWCDVGLSKLMPLSSMGRGMAHIAGLVLAIASASGGLVLIDEIENGLHHSILPEVWEILAQVAEKCHVQIIATTQSVECIAAAHQALEDELRLFRLEVHGTEHRCLTYEDEVLDVAIRHELEIR